MSDPGKPDQFCGSCVHALYCSDLNTGLQADCWRPSDAHHQALAAERQAESLAGIDLAVAILSGLWELPANPEGVEAQADQFGCSCGVVLYMPRDETEVECPNCHLRYIGDGSGKWIEKA